MGLKIVYWLRTDMQHYAHVEHIQNALGGTVLTKNPDIFEYISKKYPEKDDAVHLVRGSHEARQYCLRNGIKLVLYTGFQMIHWGYAVQVFHGASDKTYIEDKRIRQYDLLLLPGRKHRDKLQNAGFLPEPDKYRIVGYPKFDALVRGELEYEPVFDNGRPTVLYAPTWISEGAGSKCRFSPHGESSLPLWGERLIRAVAPRWNLIIKYHSRVNRNAEGIYADIKACIADCGGADSVKVVWDANITTYMHQADLMVSDISAVCYEWFHLNRPIVFANPSPEHYRPSDDPYSNTYAWRAGDVLYREEDIVPVIERNLAEDRHRVLRNELLAYSFHEPDGHALERQTAAIMELYRKVEGMGTARLVAHNLGKIIRYGMPA